MKKILMFIVCFCFITNCPVEAKENVTSNIYYLIPDFENAKEVIHENGDVEGEIPLNVYNEKGEKNLTFTDGSIYRYGYMAGGHCWRYEFKITEGFKSYRGSVSLSPRTQTSATGYWSVPVSAQSDVIELPYSLKGKPIVIQSGTVYGMAGSKYIVPYIPIYV